MTTTIWLIFLATALFTVGFKLLKFEKGNKQGDTTLYGRDIIAFSLIALSFLGAFVGSQSFQAEASGGGGGLATYRCTDFSNSTVITNALCYGPGSSGTGSVCPTSVKSPCLTQVQEGSTSCSSNTLNNNCIPAATTFTTPYTKVPNWNMTACYGSATFVPVCSTTTNLASTSFTPTQIAVFQAVNATTWSNMTTSGPVEIYSCFTSGPNGYPKCHPQANQELQINIPTGATSIQAKFCVNVVEPSQNSTAVLFPEFGTTPISDGNGQANAAIGTSAGLQCSSPFGSSNLPTGLQTLRVMGEWGFASAFCSPACGPCLANNISGLGTNIDCPVFGNIELEYTYTITQTTAGPNACFAFMFSLTATQVRPAIRCDAVPNNVVTFHISWAVGVLA